jgi:serine/threonine protein phosphatase PrpC
LTDTKAGNIGSASHLGEMQVPRDAHFIYDYSRRRVPLPIVNYMAIADTPLDVPGSENPAKKALDRLRDLIEPAVIAEEELNSEYMEKLIRENLAKINSEFFETQVAEGGVKPQASVTMVIADARRAYIGHVGTSRVYLLHTGRLYDLTPTVAAPLAVTPAAPEPPQPPQDSLPLFPVGLETPAAAPTQAPQAAPVHGTYLGQAVQVSVGYNEVEIVPGDMITLVTDGLWRTVSEEELVENLLSAMNVQRSSSQLVRLAFSRDSSDNATMTAWQYVVGGSEEVVRDPRAAVKAASREKTKTRAAEGILVALLALVLIGIFAVGFAFGWRITDTFRKPAKQKAQQAAAAKAKKEAPKQTAPSSQPQGTTPTGPAAQTATVKGQGVRMRSTANPTGDIVGLLKDGETVTILGAVTGTDSLAWSKVRGVVSSLGQNTTGEGYVRNDFLVKSAAPATTAPKSTP